MATQEAPTMIDLAKLVSQANELAPLPESAVRLAQIVADPSCDLADAAAVVEFDPALTARLLRWANSAVDGGESGVASVQEAVMRLGTAQVLSVAMSGCAKKVLNTRIDAYGLGERALWRHSLAAAVGADTIMGYSSIELPAEAFTAAILHDVGKLVMGRFLDPDVLGFIRRAEAMDHLTRLEAESLLLTVNHAELGGLIAQHWKLPPRIVQGIIYHHNPEAGADIVCDVTYLSNIVAKRIEAALDGMVIFPQADESSLERLALTADDLDPLCIEATERFTQVSSRYE